MLERVYYAVYILGYTIIYTTQYKLHSIHIYSNPIPSDETTDHGVQSNATRTALTSSLLMRPRISVYEGVLPSDGSIVNSVTNSKKKVGR